MSVQALVDEKKLVELLDSRCLRFLGEFDLRILAASEFGYSVDEMVAGFGRSQATIHRRIRHLRENVFDFLGLDSSVPLLNHWTRRHFPCCTREAQQMIENCQIFST
jgi:hypothetical protein